MTHPFSFDVLVVKMNWEIGRTRRSASLQRFCMEGHGPSWPVLIDAKVGGRTHRLHDRANGFAA